MKVYFKRHGSASRMAVCALLLSLLFMACGPVEKKEVVREAKSSGMTTKETPIFPIPQELQLGEGFFGLNEETVILVPTRASEDDLFLARFLADELADKYGLILDIEKGSKPLDDKRFILIGSLDNPLVKSYNRDADLGVTKSNPGPEGYVLQVDEQRVVIAGSDQQGAFYGLQSLRQLVRSAEGFNIPCQTVRDWPCTPFRAIKLYVPGRDNIPYFKRFLKDFMALYKYNKVILEVNAVMRLERHPELNVGWREMADYLNYTRLNYPMGTNGIFLNSTHHDAGDGDILEKEEIRDMVQYANHHFLEVIPELPTLDHSFYLLTRHRELAEIQTDLWPSAYCPSTPEVYDLLFDVFDEYIEVMQPKMIHIGRDEWWSAPIDVCPKCRGKNYFDLFVDDINKIHGYLASKNIRIAMWGDHLLENVRGVGYVDQTSETGYKYKTPGGLPLEMVKEKIPKDILIFNWFYHLNATNDSTLADLGFEQIYGNLLPSIRYWDLRKEIPGVLGGSPSSWTATNEFNFGKDLMGYYVGSANVLWSETQLTPREYFETVQRLMPGIRRDLDGKRLPSEGEDGVTPLLIASGYNKPMNSIDLSTLKSGEITAWNHRFVIDEVTNPNRFGITTQRDGKATAIQIDEDVSSFIFLHACTKRTKNAKAYKMIYNFDDSAELLGWYEVTYEDGFVETVPIRYGWNILEWDVKKESSFSEWRNYDYYQSGWQDRYCYSADAIDCSTDMQANPITFYAYEWENTRYGINISKVELKGTGKVDTKGEVNSVMLVGLSVVKKREVQTLDTE